MGCALSINCMVCTSSMPLFGGTENDNSAGNKAVYRVSNSYSLSLTIPLASAKCVDAPGGNPF